MTNPFEQHGIGHLSWSNLNLYRQEPALWTLKYLFRVRDEFGPAAWRGKAVEAGLDHWLYKRDEEAAKSAMVTAFELEALGEVTEPIEKEFAALPDYFEQATEAFAELPPPTARQLKIEHWFDGIEVPVIGYVDYLWPDTLHDLKTSGRLPSKPKGDHSRQVAIYSTVTGKDPFLTYVTPKKWATYEVENVPELMADVHRLALSVRTILSLAADKNTVARMFTPNPDSFLWNYQGDETLDAAKELWK